MRQAKLSEEAKMKNSKKTSMGVRVFAAVMAGIMIFGVVSATILLFIYR